MEEPHRIKCIICGEEIRIFDKKCYLVHIEGKMMGECHRKCIDIYQKIQEKEKEKSYIK